MSAETQGAETRTGEAPTYKPADDESAAVLLDLICELADRVVSSRLMGQGDVAIANGIRAQFTERMIDAALDGVPDPEPPSPELTERMRQAREDVINAARVVGMEDRLASVERENATLMESLRREADIAIGLRRERDEARRALDWCERNVVAVVTRNSEGVEFTHDQDCARGDESFCAWIAALAARPAETPEGRP